MYFSPSIYRSILKTMNKIDKAMFKLHLFYVILKCLQGS